MGKLKETKQVIKESLKDVFESKKGYSFEIKLNDTYTMVVSAYSLTNRDLTESVKKFDKELLEDNIKVDVFDELDLVYHLDNIDLKTLKESLVSKVCHDLGIKKTKTEKLTEGKEKKSTKARFVGNPQKEMSAFNHFMGEGVEEERFSFEDNEELQPYFDVELEDDETVYGGTSYDHETLFDFLAEIGADSKTTLSEVNDALKECGIKPIIPEDEVLTGAEEGIDSIPQLRELSRKQLAELAYRLFNVSNISFVPEDDAIVDLEYYIIDHKDDEEAMDRVLYFAHEVSGLEEGRARKWIEVEVLQGNYGQGWEDLVEYEIPADWDEAKKVYKEIRDDVKAYRENEPQYAHRVVTRKKPINNTEEVKECDTTENKGLKEEFIEGSSAIMGDWWRDEEEHQERLKDIEEGKGNWVLTPEDEEVWNKLSEGEKLLLIYSDDMGYWYDVLSDFGNEDITSLYNELAKNFSRCKNLNEKTKTVEEDLLSDKAKLAEIKLKDWYTSEFPTDELGKELNYKLTLKDIYTFLRVYGGKGNDEHGDFYNYIGVSDSVVRERIFKKLAKELGKDYKDIYNLWLKVEESCKKKDNAIKIKSGKKVTIEKPDTSKAGEEGHPIQKGLKGRVGKLEGLKEEYGPYKDEDFCGDIADLLEDGYGNASVIEPYSREEIPWELEINGKVEDDFQCREFFEYLCEDISYPVRDGHLNYYDLDEFIVKSFLDRDIDMDALKHDLAMLEGEDTLADFEEWLKSDDEEFEFWVDFDTNFDVDAYEEAADKGYEEDDVTYHVIDINDDQCYGEFDSYEDAEDFIADDKGDHNLEIKVWSNTAEKYLDESIKEDTVKQGNKWVNKGKEGTHGTFKTKKQADAQRKAMFARGYKEGIEEPKKEGMKDRLDAYVKSLDKKEESLEESSKNIVGKRISIAKMFKRDDCAGWIFTDGDDNKCWGSNSNDLGLLDIDPTETDIMLVKELIPIKTSDGEDLYIFVGKFDNDDLTIDDLPADEIQTKEELIKEINNRWQFDESLKEAKDSLIPEKGKLRVALERFDRNYHYAKQGPWAIAKGGYDLEFEVYYEGLPIIQAIRSTWDDKTRLEIGVEEYGNDYQTIDVAKFICQIYTDCFIENEEKNDEEDLTEAKEKDTTTFYSLELGVLLPEDDAEYDDYAVAFDKKHAYFDETHLESLDEQELINDATEYINSGVPRTYGVVSKIEVENFDGIEDVIAEMKENGFIEESVEFFDGEQYKAENVVWSGMKDDDETIKLDFVEIPGKEKEDEVEIEKETKTEVEEESLKEGSILYDIDYAEGPDSYAKKMDKVDSDLKAVKEKYGIKTEYDKHHKFYNFNLSGKDVSIVFSRINDLNYSFNYVLVDDKKLDNDKLSKLETSGDGYLGDNYALEPTIKAIQLYIEQEFKEGLKEASNSMKDKVERTTVNYTKEKGAIMCNKGQQAEEVETLLKAHYNNVEVIPVKHSVQIKYSGKKVTEAIEDKTADELAYERYKNGEYTYDEYVTVCKQEECEPLPEIKAEEKPEEDKWTNDFIELLDLIEFDLEKHDDADEDEKWSLIDKQGANLGDIEGDRFGDASGILDRLNIYIEDYIIDDLDRILNGLDDVSTEGLNTWEDYLNWYNTIGKEKYAEEFSAWDFEVLDLLINHAEDVDIEKAYKIINGNGIEESLKEWFNGKQLDELIALCDKLGIKGFKEIQKIKDENNFSEEEVLDYLRKKAEGDK